MSNLTFNTIPYVTTTSYYFTMLLYNVLYGMYVLYNAYMYVLILEYRKAIPVIHSVIHSVIQLSPLNSFNVLRKYQLILISV